MPTGLGWLQRECLRVIELHEADGKTPTTKDIAAVVYRVRRNSEGPRDQRSPARFYKGRAIRATEQATCRRQARYCRHQEREANIRAARTRPSGAMLFLVNGSQ
jgi:hypothetical protein